MKVWSIMTLLTACGVKYTDVLDTGNSEEPSGEETEETDTGSAEEPSQNDTEETGETGDTESPNDTGDTNDTNDVTLYGCNVAEMGICFEGFIADGWTETVARESCSAYSVENGVATETLSSGCPMTPDTVVGACILPNTFEDLVVTGWYYTSHWTEAAAEATCTEQEGLFVQ